MMKQARPRRRHPRDARHGRWQEGQAAAATGPRQEVEVRQPRQARGRRTGRGPARLVQAGGLVVRGRRRCPGWLRPGRDGPRAGSPRASRSSWASDPSVVSTEPLHTLSVGTAGPRIAFLHGLFGQGRNWSTIAKALAGPGGDGARCTLVDLPDHGRSPWTEKFSFASYAASVASTLRAIDEGPWVVVGHSLGGKVAMTLALTEPDLVAKARRRRHRAQGLRQPRPVHRLHGRDAAPAPRGACGTGPTPRRGSRSPTRGSRRSSCRTSGARARRGAGRPTSRLFVADAARGRHSVIADFPFAPGDVEPYAGPVLWIAGSESRYIKDEDSVTMRALFPRVRQAHRQGCVALGAQRRAGRRHRGAAPRPRRPRLTTPVPCRLRPLLVASAQTVVLATVAADAARASADAARAFRGRCESLSADAARAPAHGAGGGGHIRSGAMTASVLHLVGEVILGPEDVRPEAWVVGGRMTYERPTGAGHDVLTLRGWFVPGLVDAHCHVGLDRHGAVDDATAHAQATTDRDNGTLLIRDAGSPADTRWIDGRDDLPKVIRAGRHIARTKRYIRNYAWEVEPEQARRARPHRGPGRRRLGQGSSETGSTARPVTSSPAGRPTSSRRPSPPPTRRAPARPPTASDRTRCATSPPRAPTASSTRRGSNPTRSTRSPRRGSPSSRRWSTSRPSPPSPSPRARSSPTTTGGCSTSTRGDTRRSARRGRPAYPSMSGPTREAPSSTAWRPRRPSSLTRIGFSDAEVLAAATWGARAWLGRPGLEEGSDADLLVLDRDPRTDVTALGEPDAIVLRGVTW